jgi:psiF repeat
MTSFKTLAAAALLSLGATVAFAQTTTAPTTPGTALPKQTVPVIPPVTPPATTTAPSTTTTTTPATTTTAPTTTPAPNLKAKKPKAPRTAQSIKCSADADAKALKGKPRKAFMKTCKKAA